MKYIDCKKYSQEILDSVKAQGNGKSLVIMTAGNDPASASYVRGKLKDCDYCEIPAIHVRVDSQEKLLWEIEIANSIESVGGIIVQLPLPEGFDEEEAVNSVLITKDVDGFRDNSPFEPCTPEGIMYLLEKEIGDLTGLNALVIGRGKLVGIPMIARLLAADCTVTVAHSKTRYLDDMLGDYDIIVSAAGVPGLVDLKKCNAKIVIDAGVNRDATGKLCGDCYGFVESEDGPLVTPVPGGVGLMTRAMLMKHVGGV